MENNYNPNINEWYETIPTFLNQESRTLESFSSNEKYEDSFFPLDEDDKTKYHIKCLRRISEEYPTYDLFPPQLHADVFQQKKIGDCYFLSMISLVSNYGQLLTILFPIKKNPHGYYEVILFVNGWKRVIIDDKIPGEIKGGIFCPILAKSNKYTNCFYHMLLEKAWAKVNKKYKNIESNAQKNALLTLTGFQGKTYELNKELFKTIKNGIRTEGFLFGINTEEHAYSVLDADIYNVSYRAFNVLKIRNPWGIMGEDKLTESINNDEEIERFIEINRAKGKFKFTTRAIVETELENTFKNFCSTYDNGIFYMSENYINKFFDSFEQCYTMFNSTFIEYLFQFNEENIEKRNSFFYFKIKVKEKSLVQFNFTTQGFDTNGKVIFGKYCHPNFQIINDNIDVIYDIIYEFYPKDEEYLFEFHYEEEQEPPKEILFWATFTGQIELKFIGIKLEESDINYNNDVLNPIKKVYKLTEKLGQLYNRQVMIESFISNVLKINIISEQESSGYYVNFKNVVYSFLTNKEKLRNIFDILSHNSDNEFYVKDTKYKITNNGYIYCLNSNNIQYILLGKINYNLFPQFIQEDNRNNNNSMLIVDVNRCRYDITELKDLTVLNIRNIGPFEGQKKFYCHFHYLTKCITGRLGYFCDCCSKLSNLSSYYCSVCDFDLCGENCINIYEDKNNKNPNSSWPDSIKSPSHNHPLILIKEFINRRTNKYKCYSCLKKLYLNERVFYCTQCDFILCQRCSIIEKKGEEWQFKTCWHEHPLTLCRPDSKQNIFYYKEKEIEEEKIEFDKNIIKKKI